MKANPWAHLSPDEFESLREVSGGLVEKKIPKAHRERLLDLLLIEEARGNDEDMVTDAGSMRLAAGR